MKEQPPPRADPTPGEAGALASELQRHGRWFVLTGAGCSTESGIPAYRDAHGAWQHKPPIQLRDFVASEAVRRRYWARSFAGYGRVRGASPNAAHLALARFQRLGLLHVLVTQNVDGLHQKAGSERVIELHGQLASVQCLSCSSSIERDALQARLLELNPSLGQLTSSVAAPDGDMETDERECAEVPTAGQGGYNGVTVTWNEGETSTSNDCVDIPGPNVDHDKIVVGGAAAYHGDNEWTVTYQIDVTNLDPAGEIAGPALYDLTDTFDFGPGVTVDNVVVLPTPDTLAVVAGFDGDVQNVLADGTLINSAAPTISAAITSPSVIRLAIFWRPAITRSSSIASILSSRSRSLRRPRIALSRSGSRCTNSLVSSAVLNIRPGDSCRKRCFLIRPPA